MTRYCFVFDLFGVVFSKGLAHSLDSLTAVFERDEAAVARAYRRWEHDFDLGHLHEADFWAHINEELGTAVDASVLTRVVIDAYTLKPHTLDLVRYLKAHHAVIAYSNYRREWFDRLDSRFHVRRHFDDVLISSDTGALKPNREAFKVIERIAASPPSRIALIDDELSNVAAAQQWGAIGILFETPYEAEVALRVACAYAHPTYAYEYSGVFLLRRGGSLIFQRRSRRKGIANPGRLSVFGGRAHIGESPRACAVRELREELGLRVEEERLDYLCTLAWPQKNGQWGRCNYFLLREIDFGALKVTEGFAEARWPEEARHEDLTELPRLVVERYFLSRTGLRPRDSE